MLPSSACPMFEVDVIGSLTPISGKTVTTTRSRIMTNRCTLQACDESGSSIDVIVYARASGVGPNKGLKIPKVKKGRWHHDDLM